MKKFASSSFYWKVFIYLTFVLLFCLPILAAADEIKASSTTNPPPKYELSRYDKFYADPIVISEKYRGHKVNVRATSKIQEQLDSKLSPLFQSWTKETQGPEAKALVIKPTVEAIKFIGGGARFWAGPMAGRSAVLMRVAIVDQKTGEVIANPEFYQHASAMGGSWSVGGTDNAMLGRIAELIVQYMINNYTRAVGGKTGAEE